MSTFKQRAILQCFQERMNSLYGEKFVSPSYLKKVYDEHFREGIPPDPLPINAVSNDYTLQATHEAEITLLFDPKSHSFTDLLSHHVSPPRRSPPRPTYPFVINPTYDVSFLFNDSYAYCFSLILVILLQNLLLGLLSQL